MNIKDFAIGMEFNPGEGSGRWRVTDVGSRVVVAIRVDGTETVSSTLSNGSVQETGRRWMSGEEAEARGDFKGPPYGVAEHVFDEYAIQACEPSPAR